MVKFPFFAILCIVLMLGTSNLAGAKIAFVDVHAQGEGSTLNDAINKALSEAISQVHGKSIDSEVLLIESELSLSQANDEIYLSSSAYASKILSKTKGNVSEYSVLNKEKTSSGNWLVTLSAKVANYDSGKRGNRRKIALLPVTTDSSMFVVDNESISANEVSRLLSSKISMFLVQTRKFAILDRINTEAITAELALARSEHAPVEELARLGNTFIADYVLATNLNDVSFQKNKYKAKLSERYFYDGKGQISLEYRLIDSATREVVFANTQTKRLSLDDITANVGDIANRSVLDALIELIANSLAHDILQQVYPISIVKVDGDNLILSQGGNGIKVGERYRLVMLGEKLTDPYTKESLGRVEIEGGIIEITRVAPKQSLAKAIDLSIDLASSFAPKKLVLRELISTVDSPKPEDIKVIKTSIRQSLTDDDW